MQQPRQLAKQANTFFAALLVLCLLVSQWAGFSHRIEHADVHTLQADGASSLDASQEARNKNYFHSCEAFDAAALGTALQTAPLFLPGLPLAGLPLPSAAFISWQATLVCHFSSRAPPAA